MAGLRRWPRFWHIHPWELEDILIHSSKGAVNFNAIPVMQEHVSIPPHAVVTNAKHSYSFTERGTDLCFHSPLSLPEGNRSLAYFLTGVVGNPQSDEGFISPERAQGCCENSFLVRKAKTAAVYCQMIFQRMLRMALQAGCTGVIT